MNDELIRELQEHKIMQKLQEEITYIRNFAGNPYGYFDETGDEIVIYTLQGEPLGRYSKRDNMTTTMSGAPIGFGNTLINFLHPPR